MNTAKINYQGGLRTEATHLQSQNNLITDAPTDNHGKGEAFSPTDLMSTSLASCMLTLMGITANKENLKFENVESTLTKVMGDNPRRVIEIQIHFKIPNQDYTPDQKTLLEQAALNCPVAKSIHPDIKQAITFEYI